MSSTKEKSKKITISNLKNPGYRQIHVDGAIGAITPRGNLNMVFFSERNAIPRATEFELDGAKLGSIIKDSDNSLTGIVRELEFGVYMDIKTCIALKDFLEKQIKQHQLHFSKPDKK